MPSSVASLHYLALVALLVLAPSVARSQALSQLGPAAAISDTDTTFVCQFSMVSPGTGCDTNPAHPLVRATLPQIGTYAVGKLTATLPIAASAGNVTLNIDSTLSVVGGALHVVSAGTGTVTGPSVSVNRDVAIFNGTSGTLIADSNILVDNVATLTGTQTFIGKTINGASNNLTVRLGSDVVGNLPVSNLAGGSGATAGTFWSGAGSWTAIPFNSLSAGTSAAAMVVGTGGSLGVSGSGTIAATTMTASGLTGTIAAAQMPALSGDLSMPAGSTTATLNTVNSNVGTFNNANVTVNAKGLVTAATNGSGSGVSLTGADASIVVSPSPITGTGTIQVGGPSHLTTFAAGTVPMGAGASPFAATEIVDTGLGGVVIGAATGGQKGAGSINMQACFVNNVACATGSSVAFGTITGGTNTGAAMVVGTGASIAATGSGTITATTMAAPGLTGTMNAAQLPAFTGDVTSPANSNVNTLATVNSNVGSFTNANITVNGKGLVTAAANGSAPAGLQYVLATVGGIGGGGL